MGPRRALEPSGQGRGEAELPLAALVEMRGRSPPWAWAEMETGAHAVFGPGWGCLTDPGGKRMETGPGPLAPCNTFLQNQLLSFPSLS